MTDFRLLIDADVVEYLRGLKRKEQDSLLARFRNIAAFPMNHSDYLEYDACGRTIHVHIYHRHAIKFWEDSADRHLKILDVHPADRTWER